jgi:hypothetical protein
MHATELRNEVKSRGIQGTYLTTNEGVDQGWKETRVFVLRFVAFSSKISGNNTGADVALNLFYVLCSDATDCLGLHVLTKYIASGCLGQ